MTRLPGLAASGPVLALVLVCAACDNSAQTPPPAIPFAPIEDTTLKDPDNPTVRFRVDLARVEYEFPLSRADLMKITPENIATLSQEQVDQIYGRLSAGPIPDGPYRGNLFFARGDSVQPGSNDLKTRIEEIFGGIKGRLAGEKVEFLERLGRNLWKGKVFNRDQRVLRNMIEDIKPLEHVIDSPSAIMTTTIPRDGWLGRVLPANRVSLLFPAKLSCGQSLLDSRRESIIVDYNYSDEIDGYHASPDSLAGRGGLKVRDEIRMVRPGFYLGRAYTNRIFLLNFTLYNAELADREAGRFTAGGAIAEDCWPGEQQRRSAAAQ